MDSEFEIIVMIQTEVRNLMHTKSEEEAFRSVLSICRKLETIYLRLKILHAAKQESIVTGSPVGLRTAPPTPAPADKASAAFQLTEVKSEYIDGAAFESKPPLPHFHLTATATRPNHISTREAVFLPLDDDEDDVIEVLNPEDDDTEIIAEINSSIALPTCPDEDDDGADSNKENQKAEVPNDFPTAQYPCPSCELKLSSRINLKKHLTRVHGKKQLFRCSRCMSEFDNWSLLFRHQRKKPRCTFHGGKLKKCKYCFYMVKLDEFDEHRKICIAGGYQCEFCPKLYSSRKRLRDHMSAYSREKPCSKCRRSMDLHSLLKHVPECDGSVNQLCAECGQDWFADWKTYSAHLRHHEKEKINKNIPCPSGCAVNFATERNLKFHRQRIHPETFPIQCDKCSFGFNTAKELSKHAITHEGLFKCSNCDGRPFPSQTALRMHLRKVHSGTSVIHKCHVCGNVMLTLEALRVHVRRHGEQETTCEQCGKTLKHRDQVKRHMKWHRLVSTDLMFKCKEEGCTFSSAQAGGVKYHLARAHGPPTLSCQLCNKHYRSISSVKCHRVSDLHLSTLRERGLVDIWELREKRLGIEPEAKRSPGGVFLNWGKLDQFVPKAEAEKIMQELETKFSVVKTLDDKTPTMTEEMELENAVANCI